MDLVIGLGILYSLSLSSVLKSLPTKLLT